MRFSRTLSRRRRSPRRSTRGTSFAQLRLMLLGGMFVCLIAFQAFPIGRSPTADVELPANSPPTQAPHPWAEARRSKAILEAQERRPTPLLDPVPSRRGPGAPASGSVRVIDGDTFVHAGTRIRIADIDTPEVNARCPSESALAARAAARTRQLLAGGDFQLHPLPRGRDEDRYGRKLRIVTQGGRSVGDVLVAEGLARTWTGRREAWCG